MMIVDATIALDIANQRQADERALAARQRAAQSFGTEPGPIRQTLGRTLVWIGRWIEGHQHDTMPEARVADSPPTGPDIGMLFPPLGKGRNSPC